MTIMLVLTTLCEEYDLSITSANVNNSIENFWSLLKRGTIGTFHNVSAEYLPLYLAEFTFRHNFRQERDPFALLIKRVS